MSCGSDGAAESIALALSSCTQRDPVAVHTSTHFAPEAAISNRETDGIKAIPNTANIAMRAQQLNWRRKVCMGRECSKRPAFERLVIIGL